MHTFHLPCRDCTISLEDVQLQLGLPVDESEVESRWAGYKTHSWS
ncbi:hypothetical protein Godav_009969 [Gossypium davidsonii]|uniref:Uncharacterized protein n=1 Tax=Gossypium davidsonii TaxID=34287 RepID=A0A7J8SFH6_GOSDV|nr:hypothetical protein [Gossypium davidsonii]